MGAICPVGMTLASAILLGYFGYSDLTEEPSNTQDRAKRAEVYDGQTQAMAH